MTIRRLKMGNAAERSYEILQSRDGSFVVKSLVMETDAPLIASETDTPLVVSGFVSKAEALAWIDGERYRTETPEPDWVV
jgi:hypothetical protein